MSVEITPSVLSFLLFSSFWRLAHREQCIQDVQDYVFVSKSSLSRADHHNQPEAQSQEASTQQVTESCQVGDGEVVWIQAPAPQPAHHQAGHIEQNPHLHSDSSHTCFKDEDSLFLFKVHSCFENENL